MTADRPRLYPGHRHQWTDAEIADPLKQDRQIVRCTVCGFTVPRTLANLDGAMLNDAVYDEPDTDTRCPHHTPAGQCLDHQGHAGDHQHPQETRP